MEDTTEILQEDCTEISVNTESEFGPRGRQDEELTSFQKLVVTALASENEHLHGHDYAHSGNICVRKDHSYSSASMVHRHKKSHSASGVFETKPKDHSYFTSRSPVEWDESNISDDYPTSAWHFSGSPAYLTSGLEGRTLQNTQYRSNDSALDVAGCETVSDRYVSQDSIHLETVDVSTEQQIFSGISDPDISKMTIDTETEVLSSSLPENSSFIGNSFDHTYSNRIVDGASNDRDFILHTFDHTYNSCDNTQIRRDSLSMAVGVKRGRSNEDLSLSNTLYLKKQDFKKSPFLDQSYQLLEKEKLGRRYGSLKYRKREKTHYSDIENVYKLAQLKGVKSYATYSEPNKLFQDHTYEQIGDTATCFKVSDLVRKIHVGESSRDMKNNTSDHSYVMEKEDEELEDLGSALSDSGTESLNEEEEAEMSSTFERLMTCMVTQKDHAYVK